MRPIRLPQRIADDGITLYSVDFIAHDFIASELVTCDSIAILVVAFISRHRVS
jgi:hypothetical protein